MYIGVTVFFVSAGIISPSRDFMRFQPISTQKSVTKVLQVLWVIGEGWLMGSVCVAKKICSIL